MGVNAEQAVISSIVIDPVCLPLVQKYIHDGKYFSNHLFGKVYNTLCQMHENTETIDLTTICEKLPQGMSVVEFAEMISSLPTSAHAEGYAKIVRDNYARRKLHTDVRIEPLDVNKYPTPQDVLNELQRIIRETDGILQSSEEMSTAELVQSRLDEYERMADGGENTRVTPTGYVDLDRIIVGTEITENIVVAARPAMGKTAWSLNLALRRAKQGKKVLFFSLEMSKERLMDRLICIEGKVNSERMKTGQFEVDDWQKIMQATETIAKTNLILIDDAVMLSEIRAKLAQHSLEGSVGLVIIDYLQLLRERMKFQSRQIELGYYANEIARMAKAYKTTMLSLSQLSRQVEQRDNKRPRMSDLYESGAIEAAADKILFLYRDEVYDENSQDKGVAEIGVAKTRDGQIGTCKLAWQGQWFKFQNLAREV